MRKIKTILLFVCITALMISCGRDYPPNVASQMNVYKQLSLKFNNEIDSLVKRVEHSKEIHDNNKPLQILRTSDEIEVISAIANASIDGELNVDSLGITSENTIFLQSNDNIGNVNFRMVDSVYSSEGYTPNFRASVNTFQFSTASEIWEAASTNYTVPEDDVYYDSITEEQKKEVELTYANEVKFLKNLKYIILEEDALLIPPVFKGKDTGFESGYVLTYLYMYDIQTLEKIGQTMVISTNSDEISYLSSENRRFSQLDTNMISGQLRINLIMQKSKKINSIFFEDYEALRKRDYD